MKEEHGMKHGMKKGHAESLTRQNFENGQTTTI